MGDINELRAKVGEMYDLFPGLINYAEDQLNGLSVDARYGGMVLETRYVKGTANKGTKDTANFSILHDTTDPRCLLALKWFITGRNLYLEGKLGLVIVGGGGFGSREDVARKKGLGFMRGYLDLLLKAQERMFVIDYFGAKTRLIEDDIRLIEDDFRSQVRITEVFPWVSGPDKISRVKSLDDLLTAIEGHVDLKSVRYAETLPDGKVIPFGDGENFRTCSPTEFIGLIQEIKKRFEFTYSKPDEATKPSKPDEGTKNSEEKNGNGEQNGTRGLK